MPYYTQLPASFATVNADTGLIELGDTGLLNQLSGSESFARYDVAAPTVTTVSPGDDMALTDEDGTAAVSGTYVGSATLATAGTNVNVLLVANLNVQLNPVEGHILQTDDGTLYFVSEDNPTGNNLGVTITGSILGAELSPPINVPISELGEVPLLGPALASVSQAANNLLNTAVVTVDHDPTATMALEADEVLACFAAGTLILTQDGEVQVESLSVGHLVLTRDHGPRPVRWIGSTVVTAAALARNPKLRPIRIRAGALGAGTPASDLVVSPQHRILVRSKVAQRMFGTDEILVAARQLLLLDGIDIAHDLESVEYFHILFDRHEVVISNGAETESLYTGPEAMKGVGKAAHEEIFALFPELKERDYAPVPARLLASGRMGRRLASRHGQNGKPLVN
ncbi:Hint domain-containing protein [Paracoccus sp. Z118]|uniref:Hint domain-containing protein n=1 Tax=Paracoccus sp. Z118 TaxID=2851017 RepID=UPI001C2C64A4|nr:Hint domain-containing protein [Paracoccus sp. Z118]MBV0890726.1 Hint domain-containing protein [Paracoccus sp. Z118]